MKDAHTKDRMRQNLIYDNEEGNGRNCSVRNRNEKARNTEQKKQACNVGQKESARKATARNAYSRISTVRHMTVRKKAIRTVTELTEKARNVKRG